MSIKEVKRYTHKLPSTDKIPAEMIDEEGKNYVLKSINSFVSSESVKKCLSRGKRLLLSYL